MPATIATVGNRPYFQPELETPGFRIGKFSGSSPGAVLSFLIILLDLEVVLRVPHTNEVNNLRYTNSLIAVRCRAVKWVFEDAMLSLDELAAAPLMMISDLSEPSSHPP